MAGLFELIIPKTEKETNAITNPSFEDGTTGYTTGGTNTLAQSSEKAFTGLYSGKLTYSNSVTLLDYPLALNTSTTYYGMARLFVVSGWDGSNNSNIRIEFAGYTSATPTYTKVFTVGTDNMGEWILLKTKVEIASDGSGSLRITTSYPASAGKIVYIDALKVSLQDTPYFDGDFDGCYWTGTPHASTSVAPVNVRGHGVVTNLEDLSFIHMNPPNTNIAPLAHLARDLPLIPGAEHYRTKTKPTEFTLTGSILGDDFPDLHSKRTTLAKYFGADLVEPEQPFVLRYIGNSADHPTHLTARLQDFAFTRKGTLDKGAIKMIAEENPYWWEEEHFTTELNTSSSLTLNYILGFEDNAFTDMPGSSGGSGAVYALEIGADGLLYIGGSYTNWDGIADADYIAKYDPATGAYAALKTGTTNGAIRALLRLPNGNLLVAGDFTSIGGVACNRIAEWDGSTFNSLGTGANGIVRTLCLGVDGKIYAGGDFTSMSSVSGTAYIAAWDGSSWAAMASGVGSLVYAIVNHPIYKKLYVAGAFTTANGATLTGVGRVAMWNIYTSTWERVVPDGLGFDGTVDALAVGSDGTLYAGGVYSNAGSTAISKIARLTTGSNQWKSVSGGVSGGSVNRLVWSNLREALIVGGTFTTAGDDPAVSVAGLAIYKAGQWAHSGIKIPSSPSVNAYVETPFGDFYFGFSSTGTGTLTGAPVSITNNGGVRAFPKLYVKITGSGASIKLLKLINHTTRKVINFDVTLIDGQIFVLDLTPGNRSAYIQQNFAQAPDISGIAILENSDTTEWSLSTSENYVSVQTSTLAGSPTVTAWLSFQRMYSTYDGRPAS